MVVKRAEDASWLDGHQAHSKLAPCHALKPSPGVAI